MATSYENFLGNLPRIEREQMMFYRCEAAKFGIWAGMLTSDWRLQSLPQPTEMLEYWWEAIRSSPEKSVNLVSITLVITSLRLPEDGASTPKLVVG